MALILLEIVEVKDLRNINSFFQMLFLYDDDQVNKYYFLRSMTQLNR